MTTEALKSAQITNLDASPRVPMSRGAGAPGPIFMADGNGVTATTAYTSGSTYRMVRIPSNCYVKRVLVCLNAAVTTFTVDIGLYYSDVADGTSAANVAASATAIDADFFGSAVALAAIVTPTDYTNESGNYTPAKRTQPIWQAVGLSSDPGGFFDVTLTTTATTDNNSVTLLPYVMVEFIGA